MRIEEVSGRGVCFLFSDLRGLEDFDLFLGPESELGGSEGSGFEF